ncbi:hypothetical protein HK104_004584 [Borealophlyctis nickersoniae]|nr:hypothetical protein HK104_004584 [Borealophlyctis nickersoniae]
MQGPRRVGAGGGGGKYGASARPIPEKKPTYASTDSLRYGSTDSLRYGSNDSLRGTYGSTDSFRYGSNDSLHGYGSTENIQPSPYGSTATLQREERYFTSPPEKTGGGYYLSQHQRKPDRPVGYVTDGYNRTGFGGGGGVRGKKRVET